VPGVFLRANGVALAPRVIAGTADRPGRRRAARRQKHGFVGWTLYPMAQSQAGLRSRLA
jgi:hypothetical protein